MLQRDQEVEPQGKSHKRSPCCPSWATAPSRAGGRGVKRGRAWRLPSHHPTAHQGPFIRCSFYFARDTAVRRRRCTPVQLVGFLSFRRSTLKALRRTAPLPPQVIHRSTDLHFKTDSHTRASSSPVAAAALHRRHRSNHQARRFAERPFRCGADLLLTEPFTFPAIECSQRFRRVRPGITCFGKR